jgi:glucose-1-phosphate thymidylyltransferase
MKGIILAGGKGTRLYPITLALNKHLLPIHDKPMIYYPLAMLIRAEISDVLIVSAPEHIKRFTELFGDGSELGIRITYKVQPAPKGIADVFRFGAKFIGDGSVCLALGDNVFWGEGLGESLRRAMAPFQKRSANDIDPRAVIFGVTSHHLEQLGVMELDEKQHRVMNLIEKPSQEILAKIPAERAWAVPGLYLYSHHVTKIVREVAPSARGELEITDLNRRYLEPNRTLVPIVLPDTVSWRDTGTNEAIDDVSQVIKNEQAAMRLLIGSPEVAALRRGLITPKDFRKLAEKCSKNPDYYDLLVSALDPKNVKRFNRTRVRSR